MPKYVYFLYLELNSKILRNEVITISITEYEMSVDSFNDPTVLTNQKAVGMLITRIILLEPGTIQSHPDMGVGIVSKYRYSSSDDATVSMLKSDIESQISKYLPLLVGVKISVSIQSNMFIIGAQISGQLYGISIDKETLETNISYKSLADVQNT